MGRAFSRLLLVVVCGPLLGCPKAPDPVAWRWLTENCAAGEPGALDEELRAEGEPAEATLIAAYKLGPPRAELDRVGTQAAREHDAVARALIAERTYGLSAAQVESLRALTRAEHVGRAKDAYRRAFRSAALDGLVVIARSRGLELVRAVADDARSPDRATARAALERAEPPPESP